MICEFSVTLGALLLLLVGLFGRCFSAAGVALRAQGGVWSAFGSCGRVLKVEWWYCQTDFFVYLLCRRMNSADRNDLMPAPAQEKLEWVTPKILLMDAGDTDSKAINKVENNVIGFVFGPS